MIEVTQEMIDKARDLIAFGNPEAVGYRIMIKPIEASTKLTASEKKKYPTLAAVDFDDKTENQADRLTKGTQHGIAVSIGKYAYKGPSLSPGGEWIEEGDVLIFDRYTGIEVELPPGSGKIYRFTNDESILGVMRESKHG